MASALRTFGRILARHWPALMAWYLGGEALHRLLIELAGFVGGHTTLGGLLLLPLAVASRLVSYVAMYLTVRPTLPHSRRDDAGGRGSSRRRPWPRFCRSSRSTPPGGCSTPTRSTSSASRARSPSPTRATSSTRSVTAAV